MQPLWLSIVIFPLLILAEYHRVEGPNQLPPQSPSQPPTQSIAQPPAHVPYVRQLVIGPEFPRLALDDLAEDGSWNDTVIESSTTTTPIPQTFPTPSFMRPPVRSRAMRMKKAKDGVKIALAKSPASPSNRLLNDILIIPPPKGSKLYVLLLISVHDASEQAWKGYECGKVNLDGFIRLTAFIHALKEANGSPLLASTLSMGAVIVDTCSSDLRTIADLYELLAGTNIQKSDLIAVIRDDDSHLPNVDLFISQLGLPVIFAFPDRNQISTVPLSIDATPISTASPLQGQLITSLLLTLKNTNSSCFSLLYDTPHKGIVSHIRQLAERLDMCIEERIQIDEDDFNADLAVRRLLLTEARAVFVFLGQPQWKQLLRAFREELVIAGRFILFAPQHSSWTSSRSFKMAWPFFDQILVTSSREIDNEESHLREDRLAVLAQSLPEISFQKSWIRHFWATAYECHVPGEPTVPGEEQFSRPCKSRDEVNFGDIAPSVDILPIERAVEALATSLRKLVDSTCPGAIIETMQDCTNQPYLSLSSSLHNLEFIHSPTRSHLSTANRSTFFDLRINVRRARIFDGEIQFEQMGVYDESTERLQSSAPLTIAARDGTEKIIQSNCPSCICSTVRLSRRRIPSPPELSSSLRSPSLLFVSIASVLVSLLTLLGIYYQLLSDDAFRVCGMISYAGLTTFCILAPFFVLPSSALSCSMKRFGLSTSMAAIYGPIFVESAYLSTHRFYPSGSTLFWLSMAIVALQAVIVGEWSLFESSSTIIFVQGPEPEDIGAWRCAPGDNFEGRLLLSGIVPCTLIFLSLLLAVCRARWMRPVTSLLSLHLATFYFLGAVGLPLISFERRDIIFSTSILVYVMTFLIFSLCRSRTMNVVDDTLDGKGVGLNRTRMNCIDWNDEDERRFNEAMAAASRGTTIERFNSKILGGHVFFINQNTGALTAQAFREPTPLIDYPIGGHDNNIQDDSTMRPMERLYVNTRQAPPQPTPRNLLNTQSANSIQCSDESQTPTVYELNPTDDSFIENERF